MRNSCLTRPPARIQTHRPATAWEMPGCVRTSLGWHSSWRPWDGQHAWRQENWVAYSAKNPHSHSLQPADKGDLSEQGHSSVQNSRGALGKAQAPFLQPPWKTLAPEGRLSVCSPVILDPARNQSKTWGREFVGQKLLSSFNSAWLYWVVQKFRSGFFPSYPFLIILFTYLFLPVLGLGCCTGVSLVAVCGLLTGVASLVTEHGLWGDWASVFAARGLSSCSSPSLEHRLSSCDSRAYLVAPCCVESSQTRDRTGVSCIGRQILYQ